MWRNESSLSLLLKDSLARSSLFGLNKMSCVVYIITKHNNNAVIMTKTIIVCEHPNVPKTVSIAVKRGRKAGVSLPYLLPFLSTALEVIH